MESCRVCGETKPLFEFEKIMYFVKYKRKGKQAIWCKECQRMFVAWKREEEYKQEHKERYEPKEEIVVSFH